MQDLPTPAAIVDLVIAQMGEAPLAERSKFETRVMAAALQLVSRALKLGPASDARELQRLRALLGADGDLETLNLRLCEHIRDSAVTLDTPGLAAHLRATTLEKLAIDQPSYAAYRRALEDEGRT